MSIRNRVKHAGRMATLMAASLAILIGSAVPAMALAPQDIWYAVSITLYDIETEMEPTVVIAALAKEGTELPVEGALAIPKGVTMSWAGEVLGGDPANDPMLDYRIEQGTEYDTVRFVLQKSLMAQFEMTAAEGVLDRTDFTAEVSLEWTSAGEIERARIGVAAPMGTHMEEVAPEPTVEARSADVLYSVETSPVAAGETLQIAGTVAPGMAPEVEVPEPTAEPDLNEMDEPEIMPAAVQPEPEDTSGSLNITGVIIGVVAAIVAVLVVIVIGRLRGGAAASPTFADTAEEEPADDQD